MKKLGQVWLLLVLLFCFATPMTVYGQSSSSTAQFQVLPSPTKPNSKSDQSANKSSGNKPTANKTTKSQTNVKHPAKLPGDHDRLPQMGDTQLQVIGWLVLVVVLELGLLWHQERRRQHEN